MRRLYRRRSPFSGFARRKKHPRARLAAAIFTTLTYRRECGHARYVRAPGDVNGGRGVAGP